MNIDVHHEPHSFEKLRPEWNHLVANSLADTPFSTWEFLATWWEAYAPGELWLITVHTDSGELIGLVPLYQDTNKALCSVGGLDVTDYIDFIIHKDHSIPVYSALANFFEAHKTDFSHIELYNLHPASPTIRLLCDTLQGRCSIEQKQIEVTPQIALPDTFEGYLESLDKKQRGELRRKLRRAEAGIDEKVDWYVVDTSHDIQAEMNRFFALMASSSPEKEKFLQNPQHKTFFEQLLPRMLPTGWVQLVFLRVDGEAVATYFNFDYGDRIWVYNSGFSYKYEGLSTGIVLLLYVIQDAIARGRKIFDFLRGNETYKYRMGAKDAPLYQLTMTF